ncbi:MAG TPA: mannosyltransferase family protein [Actinomycetota bacterium]|nr:mannosyltransferase family protein [Actinomycetota bacterium]
MTQPPLSDQVLTEAADAVAAGSPDATAPEIPGSPDRSAWIHAFRWVLITRLLFLSIAYAGTHFLTTTQGPVLDGFRAMWTRWDALHFQQVAELGYTAAGTDPHATAFFPLFPMLMRLLNFAGIPFVVAGMLISAGASIVAFAFLYRWAEEEIGPGAGHRSVLYLAFFPTAVFLVAPYSEALFMAGAIPAFYYGRKGQWHLAAFPAAVATGARFAGAFLLVGLALEFVRQKDWTPKRVGNAALALVVGTLPLVAYGAYLERIKGDFFYYFTDQREGWGRGFVGPIDSFKNTWNTFEGAGYPANFIFAWRVEIIAAIGGLAFVAWALMRREWGYAGFMGTFMASLITSSWYYSIPRMMLSFFPIMLLVAAYTHKRQDVHEVILIVGAALASMGVIVFTRGAWFY